MDLIPKEQPKSWLLCLPASPHPQGAVRCRESTPGVSTFMAQVPSSLPTKASPSSRSTPGNGSAGTGTAQEGATASHHGIEEKGITCRPLKGLLWNFRLVLSPTPTPAVGQHKPSCSPIAPAFTWLLATGHICSQQEQVCQSSLPAPKEVTVHPLPTFPISVWCSPFLGHPFLAGRNLFCVSDLLW